jgi:hypothetical protein
VVVEFFGELKTENLLFVNKKKQKTLSQTRNAARTAVPNPRGGGNVKVTSRVGRKVFLLLFVNKKKQKSFVNLTCRQDRDSSDEPGHESFFAAGRTLRDLA